ncbi:hypothetical protein EGI11_03180 [Chryseobacterium sp. H3056]|uniref:Phage conserved hypothetical protein C-terminal domain-containing protein n=1 Tax=Kaistella daneshvariae TaxID=2487074 RepID=A0A3N0WXG7_9FLAO|nr:conserved phage C-terminal domain-containing protein [Kaistella daneshvariae]ROI09774.1 hypothetical protein EGI11_03180 [Kaistella daneshvariae]
MEGPEISTPEIEILNYLNEVTGSKFRPIKSNLTKVSALFKSGFTKEDIIQVIQLKVVQWKNNPVMAPYLRPSTLFRDTNFDNYLNEVEKVKQNPTMYREHYEQLNQKKSTSDNTSAFSKINTMFGKDRGQ